MGAFEHDAAVAHDVDPVRDLHGDRELLLDQQDRDVALGDALQQSADALRSGLPWQVREVPEAEIGGPDYNVSLCLSTVA